MTNKQKQYIEYLEEFSHDRFTGDPNNQKDVSDFINRNKEIARLNSLDSWQLN